MKDQIKATDQVKVDMNRNWVPSFIGEMREAGAFGENGSQAGRVLSVDQDSKKAIVQFGKGLAGCLEVHVSALIKS